MEFTLARFVSLGPWKRSALLETALSSAPSKSVSSANGQPPLADTSDRSWFWGLGGACRGVFLGAASCHAKCSVDK
eukprot:1411906-Amphidinium_carterae.1